MNTNDELVAACTIYEKALERYLEKHDFSQPPYYVSKEDNGLVYTTGEPYDHQTFNVGDSFYFIKVSDGDVIGGEFLFWCLRPWHCHLPTPQAVPKEVADVLDGIWNKMEAEKITWLVVPAPGEPIEEPSAERLEDEDFLAELRRL